MSSNISLSSEAIQKALELQAKNPSWQNLPLRLYLEGKGCDGFYYGVSFDQKTEQDLIFRQHSGNASIELIVDADTLNFVDGSKVIWVDDERGCGFLVENPNHRKFRGKFYKRRIWQQRLEQRRQAISSLEKESSPSTPELT